MSDNTSNVDNSEEGFRQLSEDEIARLASGQSMPTTEAIPDEATLQAKLRDYQQAIRGEWEVEQPHEDDDPKELRRKAKKVFIKSFPDVAAGILSIALGGESEAQRLGAQKFIIEYLSGKYDSTGGADPLEDFLERLNKKQADKVEDKS